MMLQIGLGITSDLVLRPKFKKRSDTWKEGHRHRYLRSYQMHWLYFYVIFAKGEWFHAS